MTDIEDAEKEMEQPRKKKSGEGEGEGDSWLERKSVTGVGIARLPPHKLKEVMADWRHLDVKAIMEAVAEFFSDLPMRASANLSVAWERTKDNVKSFALVNWILDAGEKAAQDLELTKTNDLSQTKETGRVGGKGKGTRGFIKRDPKVGPHFGPSGGMGPTGG